MINARSRLALVLLLCALTTCSYPTETTSPYKRALPAPPAGASGEEVFLRECAWCHGRAGGGTERAPDLKSGTNGPALTDFMLSTGRMPLEHPGQTVQRRPPYLDDETIAAVVSYVESLQPPGPPIPDPVPDSGDIALGAQLYAEHCAACHSTTGVGGALSSDSSLTRQIGARAPPIDGDATQIAEAIVTGPGTMPVFGQDVFTEYELNSLVRYALDLQDPVDEGGWAIGFLGPFAEGAVAWLVGLVLLVLLIRWIGTSTREEE